MIIGVPKEIKNLEFRVGLSPRGVRELTKNKHEVIVETNAGYELGFDDEDYKEVGALIAKDAAEVYAKAEMIVKVKEPQESECKMIRRDQVIFSYLHLAAEPKLTKELLETGCIGIAYETVTCPDGTLPLLAPMSEVAGRVAVQAGARCLEKSMGGSGVLLSGVPGVTPGKVAIIGGGSVGTNAAIVAAGMGAHVTVLDNSLRRIRELNDIFGSKLNVVYSTVDTIEEYVEKSDLVIGAVLIPGAAAPKLVTKEMIKKMPRGSVFADVAIDQGGCSETSRPTTHAEPTYRVNDVIHYCVTNIPGAVARTSSRALENSTLPYILSLADNGYKKALKCNHHFLNGLNIANGAVTYKAVANDLGYEFTDPMNLL